MEQDFTAEERRLVDLWERHMRLEFVARDAAATVLVQLGLLAPGRLPVAGAETARNILDPSLRSNALIRRAEGAR